MPSCTQKNIYIYKPASCILLLVMCPYFLGRCLACFGEDYVVFSKFFFFYSTKSSWCYTSFIHNFYYSIIIFVHSLFVHIFFCIYYIYEHIIIYNNFDIYLYSLTFYFFSIFIFHKEKQKQKNSWKKCAYKYFNYFLKLREKN